MDFGLPPADQVCFIDANILYYSFVSLPTVSDYCTILSKEIVTGARRAATISSAVADAVHKVMCSEVVKVHQRPRAGLIGWIKKHPHALEQLTEFNQAADEFSKMPLHWLPVGSALLVDAGKIAVRHGLMINDALNVAAMRANGLAHLVTNDDDFDRVPGITVWKPR